MGRKEKSSNDGYLGPGLELTLVIVSILSVFFAAYLYLDYRHASAIKLSVLDTRLELKIKGDLETAALRRVWDLKDRASLYPGDQLIIKDLREAETTYAVYQKEVMLLKSELVEKEN